MSTAKRDRQRANRAAKIAAQQAAARRRRNRRLLIAAVAVALMAVIVAVVVSLGGDDIAPASTTTAASTDSTGGETADTSDAVTGDLSPAYQEFLAQPTACDGTAPDGYTAMQFEGAEQTELGGNPTATIETSCGPIVIELDAEGHPETVNSFAFLAEQGYYDGTACHRVVAGFMIQCGDPTATGTGGPGYVVPDEFPEEGFVYERGVVAMANAGAGSTGSQFFIVTGDASHLGPQFSVLGRVVGGEETLDQIESIPVELNSQGTEESRPLESVYIESVTIG